MRPWRQRDEKEEEEEKFKDLNVKSVIHLHYIPTVELRHVMHVKCFSKDMLI